VKTPPWDTFAGAEYNYDFITVMPDGKGLELGSVINLGQRFAKAFDIKYMDTDEQFKYIYQTCYGVSERVLGAVIGIHGDEKGLFFPPEIAPIQVVIVPIAKPEDVQVLEYARRVREILEKSGVRVFIDDDLEKSPGWKYYYWEMKGVPVRIEVGPREVGEKTVTIARRDGAPRIVVKLDELIPIINEVFREVNTALRERALGHLRKLSIIATSCTPLENLKGLIIAPWDGSREEAEELEKTFNKGVLGEITESPIPLPPPIQLYYL